MKHLYVLLLLISFSTSGWAQRSAGARLVGLASAGVALSDPWSAFSNPAGIAFLDKTQGGLTYGNQSIINAIRSTGAVFILPHNLVNTAFSLQHYGFDAYAEYRGTITLAKKYHKNFSYAINANYHQVNIVNYGKATAFSADIGMQYVLSKEVKLGLSSYNIGMSKVQGEPLLNIPTSFSAGLVWTFVDNSFLSAEYYKKMNADASIRMGIEYAVAPKVFLRGGYASNPSAYHVGIGALFEQWVLDFACSFQSYLGTAGYFPEATVNYVF